MDVNEGADKDQCAQNTPTPERACAKHFSYSCHKKESKKESDTHTDAVQGFMKIPFQAKTLGADLISISSHKVHGPKGVGALYISPRLKSFPPLLFGGGQENGFRSGTEGTPAIFGFAAACEVGKASFAEDIAREKALLDGLVEKLCKLDGLKINGAHDAPHILSLSVPGVPTQNTLNLLQEDGICISAGSACHRGKASHVLVAMGLEKKVAAGVVRISFGPETTFEDIDALYEALLNHKNTRFAML